MLRNRIDSCDYDLDQLLLGTILFTLLFFLLPTVLVFYITFTSARMAIIFLKASLDTLLACLNHFPLFALMLRVKDSRRLPGKPLLVQYILAPADRFLGGICFELRDTHSVMERHKESENTPPTSYIILKVSVHGTPQSESVPLTMSHSPSLYPYVQCSTNTSSSATAYGNTISPPAFSSAWQLANSCPQSTAKAFTAYNIACCPLKDLVSGRSGVGLPKTRCR